MVSSILNKHLERVSTQVEASFGAFSQVSQVAGDKEAGCGDELADNEAHSGLKSAVTENVNREDTTVKNASNSFWSKEASDLVARNLIRDVVGSVKNDASNERPDGVSAAKLPAEQIPNGQHSVGAAGEGAEPVATAKLPKEQTPVKNFDSGIVQAAKSSTAEVKTAGDEIPAPAAPMAAPVDPMAPVAPIDPMAAPATEETPAPAPEEATASVEAKPYEVEACGIRMASSAMGYDTKISAEDAALLSQIFG